MCVGVPAPEEAQSTVPIPTQAMRQKEGAQARGKGTTSTQLRAAAQSRSREGSGIRVRLKPGFQWKPTTSSLHFTEKHPSTLHPKRGFRCGMPMQIYGHHENKTIRTANANGLNSRNSLPPRSSLRLCISVDSLSNLTVRNRLGTNTR